MQYYRFLVPTCPPSTCTTAFMTDVRAFLTAPMADATCTTYIIQVTCPGLTNTQFNADGASVFAANIPVDITCNSATGMYQYPRLGIPTDVTRIDCA
uniref:Antifreeze protein n=1 Tax=Panagrolaimus davidi TaxID=227884 RepID=A0A914PCP6_9BILA